MKGQSLFVSSAAATRRRAPLAGSIAIHLAGLLLVSRLPNSPISPRFTATTLFAPAPVPVTPPARVRVRSEPAKPVMRLPADLRLKLPPPVIVLAVPPDLAGAHSPATVSLPPAPIAVPAEPRLVFSATPIISSTETAPALPAPTGLFNSVPLGATPVPTTLQARTGGFGTVPAARSQHNGPSAAGEPAGFDSQQPAPVPEAHPAVSAPGGFGGIGRAEPGGSSPHGRPVAAGAFSTVAAQPALRSSTAPGRSSTEPLEILDKPRPAYTEAARRARIEGDVVLEALFLATGHLRIIRIVSALGYGLEKNAIDAAEKIRFRPAMENGRAVDTVAKVRITFQMVY